MKLVHVQVMRGKMMGVPRTVGEHEVAVLQAVHGDTAVRVLGDAGYAPTPDATEEYERLGLAYGVHNDRGASFVELAFGRGPAQLAAMLAASDDRKRKAA